MKHKMTQIEKWFSAITFAEAGEHDTALSFINDTRAQVKTQTKSLSWFDRIWSAVTFAEEGCFETALALLNDKPRKVVEKRKLNHFLNAVGLEQVRYNYSYLIIQ